MNTQSFARSIPGRILIATAGVNGLAMGALALTGPGSSPLVVLSIVPLASIIAGLVVVGLTIHERDDDLPLLLVLTLPFIGGFAYYAMCSAPRAGTGTGLVFVALGVVGLVLSVRGAQRHFIAQSTPHGSEARVAGR